MIRVLASLALVVGLAACKPAPGVDGASPVAASFVPSVRPVLAVQRTDLTGQWQMIGDQGQRCFVTLLGFAGSSARHALEVMKHGGCPSDLDRVAGWIGAPGEVVLTDRGGRPIGRLREEPSGNFVGLIMGGFGPTAVRLERRD